MLAWNQLWHSTIYAKVLAKTLKSLSTVHLCYQWQMLTLLSRLSTSIGYLVCYFKNVSIESRCIPWNNTIGEHLHYLYYKRKTFKLLLNILSIWATLRNKDITLTDVNVSVCVDQVFLVGGTRLHYGDKKQVPLMSIINVRLKTCFKVKVSLVLC